MGLNVVKLKEIINTESVKITEKHSEITLEISAKNLIDICNILKNNSELLFSQLIDLCVVDYLHYGQTEWTTDEATSTGYSRAVESLDLNQKQYQFPDQFPARFAIVYHLLSIKFNYRLRLKVFVANSISSVVNIWNCANWYEREAFDLFGIEFTDHPDLRRILTDYGFVGHPFRKDFPLIGKVEVKYDEKQGKVVNQPVSIEPRILVPKVIREAELKSEPNNDRN